MKQSDKAIPEYHVFLNRVGKRIMDLRMKNHFTRKHLAKLADISEKYLYEIEFGKKGCSCYILYRLAKSLKISMDDLTECDEICCGDYWDVWNRPRGYPRDFMEAAMETVFHNFEKIS